MKFAETEYKRTLDARGKNLVEKVDAAMEKSRQIRKQSRRDELHERLIELGVEYNKRLSTPKLEKLLEEHTTEKPEPEPEADTAQKPEAEAEAEKQDTPLSEEDRDATRKALFEFSKVFSRDAAVKLLGEFGAEKISDLTTASAANTRRKIDEQLSA